MKPQMGTNSKDAELIVGRATLMAARAHRLGAAPGPHLDFDRPAVLAKTSLLIDEAGKVLAVVQQGDQPHESKTSKKRHIGQHLNGQTCFIQ
jgi:hypothetical protein